METRVGLVGLGRIGKNIFRILYKREDIRVAAISEIADHKGLEYLLRFDTMLGRFPDEVAIKEGNLYVVGRQVPMISEKEQPQAPWGDLGVHTVIEATSKSRTRAELEKHLAAGAKRVISLAPPQDAFDIMAVMGVNDEKLESRHRIVSNASSTVHAVTPVLKNSARGVRDPAGHLHDGPLVHEPAPTGGRSGRGHAPGPGRGGEHHPAGVAIAEDGGGAPAGPRGESHRLRDERPRAERLGRGPRVLV